VEGVIALASEFLSDKAVVEAALEVDRVRMETFFPLRDAFVEFRDSHCSLSSLAQRIDDHVSRTFKPASGGPEQNAWGFKSSHEWRFAERFDLAGRAVPELDVGALLRSYLSDEDRADDDENVQVLLAFGEFVAGLDAQIKDAPPLGVGPAAHFLTFAWHCLSGGSEPVFQRRSDRAVRAIAQAGGVPGSHEFPRGEWEPRFKVFYAVTRQIATGLTDRPNSMSLGWAIEHAMDWIVARIQRTGEMVGDPTDPGGSGMWRPAATETRSRPTIVGAKGSSASASSEELEVDTHLEQPRAPAPPAPPAPAPPAEIAPPGRRTQRLEPEQISPRHDAAGLRPETDPLRAPTTEVITHERDSGRDFRSISRKGKVVVESPRLLGESGGSLNDALPPDRTPPVGIPRKEASRAAEADAFRDVEPKAETAKLKAPAPPPPPAAREEKKHVQPWERETEDSDAFPVGEMVKEFRGEVRQVNRGGGEDDGPPGRLAHDLHLDPALCEDMLRTLAERGRMLLVGPAHVGKTYVARRLAIHAAGHEDRVLFLRLHPEASYRDLVLDPGVLRAFCERADKGRDRHVVVLDELDRGDAARALGEVVGALADRGGPVALAATGESFTFPRTVEVIATARELPHDPALVGRFPTVRLPCDPEVLRGFLASCRPALVWVADMLARLNARLVEVDQGPLVGHGLFMDPLLDVAKLERVWRHEVLPLVEAHGVDSRGLTFELLRPRS
jgi:ATPase family associated with various cellular activities (AAA)